MNRPLVMKYVDVLLSGKYKQITHMLKDNAGGCCAIGVAVTEFGHESYMSIAESFGLENIDKIIQANDSGKSFREIASMILGWVSEAEGKELQARIAKLQARDIGLKLVSRV